MSDLDRVSKLATLMQKQKEKVEALKEQLAEAQEAYRLRS